MVEEQPHQGESVEFDAETIRAFIEELNTGGIVDYHGPVEASRVLIVKGTLEMFRPFIINLNAGWIMDLNAPIELEPDEGVKYEGSILWYVRRKWMLTQLVGGAGAIIAYQRPDEKLQIALTLGGFPDPKLFWEAMDEFIEEMKQWGFVSENDEAIMKMKQEVSEEIRLMSPAPRKDAHPERTQEKLATLFISYSRKDSEFAHRVADDLRAAGYSVWVDISGLRGGQRWVQEIDKAVRACDAFVLVISPDSMASSWVTDETLLARQLKKQIIPIMWQEAELPVHLVGIHYVDFRGSYDDAVQELYKALPPATFPPNSNPSPPSSTPNLLKPKRLSSSCQPPPCTRLASR